MFCGGFGFLRCACSLGIPLRDPLNPIKSPIFTNTRCRSTCLYNAPSLHTVENMFKPFRSHGVLPQLASWSCAWRISTTSLQRDPRGRELNTNLFSQTFRHPRDIPAKKCGFPGFRRTYGMCHIPNFLAPDPSRGRPPHPTRKYLDQNIWVWVRFSLGVFQRSLTLILLKKYRDANGRRIVIQIGGVYSTFCQE